MRRTFIFLFLFLVLVGTVAAQSTFRGGLSGSVTDPQGAVIPQATIEVRNEATGQIYNTVATGAGEFSVPDLPLGDYSVTVAFPGFSTVRFTQIRISAGAIFALPVTLYLAATSTTVEVQASALTLDTATPARTFTLPKEEVKDIPINGRS